MAYTMATYNDTIKRRASSAVLLQENVLTRDCHNECLLDVNACLPVQSPLFITYTAALMLDETCDPLIPG